MFNDANRELLGLLAPGDKYNIAFFWADGIITQKGTIVEYVDIVPVGVGGEFCRWKISSTSVPIPQHDQYQYFPKGTYFLAFPGPISDTDQFATMFTENPAPFYIKGDEQKWTIAALPSILFMTDETFSSITVEALFNVRLYQRDEKQSTTHTVSKKVLSKLHIVCYAMPSARTYFYYGFKFTNESWQRIIKGDAGQFETLQKQGQRFLAVDSRKPSQTYPEVNKSVTLAMKDHRSGKNIGADGKFWEIMFVE